MSRSLRIPLAAVTALVLAPAPASAEVTQAAPTARNVAVDAAGKPDSTGQAGRHSSALSRDGRYLFFFTYNGSNLAPTSIRKAGGTSLYLLRKDLKTGAIIVASRRPDGRTPMPATDVGDLPVDLADGVAVSKDGSKVFYGAYYTPYTGLHVTDLAQGRTRVVLNARAGFGPEDLALSDDGTTVAFAAVTSTGEHIYRRRLLEPMKRVDNCAVKTGCNSRLGTEGFVDMSGDGKKVVYAEADGSRHTNVHVLMYNASTGGTTDLTAPINRDKSESFSSPTISRDGLTVATGYGAYGVYGVLKKKLGTGRLGPGDLVARGGTTAQGGKAQAMSRNGRVFAFTYRGSPGALRGYYKIGTAAAKRVPVPAGNWSEMNLDVSDDGKTLIWHRMKCTNAVICDWTSGIWLARLP
jgi:hypothetical protein